MRIITLHDIDNEMEMFDGFVDTQSEAADSLSATFECSGYNAIALFNTYGITATVTISTYGNPFPYTFPFVFGDTTATTALYSKTVNLGRDKIEDWWDYFFATPRYGNSDVVFYFPASEYATATVTINYPGGTAKCGLCAMGLATECGKTLQGVKVGISDYSVVETNTFGVSSLSVGTWAKRLDAEGYIETANFNTLYNKIVQNRGIPAVYDLNNYAIEIETGHTSASGLQSLILYGYAADFDPSIEINSHITFGIEVNGLI